MRISLKADTAKVIIASMIVGFLLRLYFAITLPVQWDSGIFLYWASLINTGATPYRDFFIRDPVYIYLIAFDVRILGTNYLALSLISIVPSVATIPLLYRIGKEVFDNASGLVSDLIFSFAPTIIWYGTVFDERSLMLFFSVVGLWALVKVLKTPNPRFLALFGVVIGVGTFAYRGMAIYAMTLPVLLAVVNYKAGLPRITEFKNTIYQMTISLGAFVAGFGSIFLFFSATSSFSWMVSNFVGFGGQPESAGWFIFGQVASTSFKERIFYVAVREWLYLIIPAGIFGLAIFLRFFSKPRNLAIGIAGMGSIVFLVAALVNTTSFPQSSYGAYEPSSYYVSAFLAFLIILAGIAPAIYRILRPSASRTGSTRLLLLIYWFLSTGFMVALFGVPLVNYYYYFAPSLALLASPTIASALRRMRSDTKASIPFMKRAGGPALFLALLLANAAVTAGMLYSTPMTWRNQSLSSLYDIARYVQSNTNAQDEILVGNPAIALFAHRGTALGITQLQIYGRPGPEPFDPYPNSTFHLFPNIAEISQFMASGGVKYVVADNSPPTLDIIGLHPLWKAAFTTNFVLETHVDGVAIFRYSPTWDLSEHLDSITADSNSTLYHYVNQTWVDDFDHSLISSERYKSLPTVQGTTQINQVLFHPPFVAGNSYIEINILGNRYSNLTTNFALADSAIGKSDGVTYSVQVSEGPRQVGLVNNPVTTNTWQKSSILLPTGTDLTIVLTSNSGPASSYDWLEITFTLQP